MTGRRHILVINHSVGGAHPPYAPILGEICAAAAASGHRVTIVAMCVPRPVPGCRVVRLRLPGVLPMRLRRVLFPLAALLCVLALRLRDRADIVLAASHPPVLSGACAGIAAAFHRARLIYHLQDLHPEITAAVGSIRPGGPVHRLAAWIEGRTRRRADPCVTLTPDMARVIAAGTPGARLTVLPNPAPPAMPPRKTAPSGPIQLVYAGTVGPFQGIAPLVAAMGLVPPEMATLTIVGQGRAMVAVHAAARGLPNVRFTGWVLPDRAANLLGAADFGVVSLAAGTTAFAAPSKLGGVIALGVPALMLFDRPTSDSRRVTDAGAGLRLASRDPGAIAAEIRALATDCDLRARLRTGARHLARQQPGSAATLPRWMSLFNQSGDRPCSTSRPSSSLAPRGRGPTCSATR